MARVDPEALEREADELARKYGLMQADPETDTPPQPTPDPAPQADTPVDPPAPAAEDELDRGDPENSVDDIEELDVLRERYKNAQAAMTRATQRASEQDGIIADLRREVAELRANPPSSQPQTAPQNADEAEQLLQNALKEWPEIVGPLLKRLERVEATAQTAQSKVVEREQTDANEAHLAAIREKHSDVDTIAASPEFQGWVTRQTPYWRTVAERGNAEEVVELLDRYKDATGRAKPPQPQRESAIERARRVAEPELPRGRKPDPNGSKRTWTRKEIGAMSLEEYEAQRDEIDRAYLEGRVR